MTTETPNPIPQEAAPPAESVPFADELRVVAAKNDVTAVKPGVKKEPQFAIDISTSMTWPAADGSPVTRWQLVTEALGSLVAALEVEDSEAAAEKAAGEDAGGVMTVVFGSTVTDLEDLSSDNWRHKLEAVEVGGGTLVRPAVDKLTELYMEEFGDVPDMDRPLQLMTVITDGEAQDIADFITYLTHLSSRTYVVIALVGYGTDHAKAVDQYKNVAASFPSHLRVVTLEGTTQPEVVAKTLMSLIG